ncbi:MAG: hypothetical protein CMJ98_13910 [Planctomycetes bacterium]|jgi:uncharacterized membrane protein|nr:hypothetical protein [Planctomycetota bacterium]
MDGVETGSDGRRLAVTVVQTLFFLAFPLIVWLAYTHLGTRALGTLLIGLYAVAFFVRGRGSAGELGGLARRHLPLVLLVLLAVVTGSGTLLLFVPMFVSLYLFWTFAETLRSGMPMIERFARMVEVDLPDFCVPYCRKVTQVWCFFLAANALCVGALALWAPLEWWTLYAGLIFYLLMGALLGGEFVFRKLWFRYYGDGLADRIFAKLFPPEQTENGRRSLLYVETRLSRPSAGTGAKC